jgi:hypothetical protein
VAPGQPETGWVLVFSVYEQRQSHIEFFLCNRTRVFAG